MALIRLIYVSSATRALTNDDLESILNTSRQFNGQHDITGMLLFSDGNFMQILEGEEGIVSQLMDEHIARDTRHHNILVLDREPITLRDFPGWSMGFRRLSGDSAAALDGSRTIAMLLDDTTHGIRPGAALELLHQFAQH